MSTPFLVEGTDSITVSPSSGHAPGINRIFCWRSPATNPKPDADGKGDRLWSWRPGYGHAASLGTLTLTADGNVVGQWDICDDAGFYFSWIPPKNIGSNITLSLSGWELGLGGAYL